MPITKGQGQSDMTRYKQKDYDEFLSLWFKLARNALRNKNYRRTIIYIDTNAGSGHNIDSDCPGSPVIFCEYAKKEGLPYLAYLIEKDEDYCQELRARVKNYNATVICGNNQETISPLLSSIPPASLGLMYIDPNGVPDQGLIKLASNHKKSQTIDILIRYNSTAVWRNHHNGHHLDNILSSLNKTYKWGKEYYQFDKWKWSFLLGMNYRFGDWQSRGWKRLDTEAGHDLEERLAYGPNQRQKKRQIPLIEPTKSTCSTPDLELSERRSLRERAVSVSNAIRGRLRKFTT